MSDSRSCGRCIYYNSITNECGEESKCMRDVDEAKYTSYIAGKKQGKLDGARVFAELLKKKFNEFIDYDDDGEQTFESNPDLVWSAIDEVLAEWQKGKENEIK